MSKKHIDFYFDFGSPTSYLAWTQLPGIAKEAGVELRLHPILLGGVFQATGNHSPAQVPRKGAWMQRDLERYAARYGVQFVNNPFFPINTMHLMRGAIGYRLRKPASFDTYTAAVYRGMWADGLNLGDQAVLADVLQRAGLDPQEFLALIQDPEVKEKLRADTEAAIERGLFGAPTMFVDDEMYFGQDRLDFVREAVQ
ncbi:2-hydroxychromene-2-carboxylate isomerase [Noviherbaspirillum denitrificans]|uniref:2-hydroxychromene-2-carboxylate isomerase n=1 Tax=Noviherbaspirillum denitrificans TaxID=1968433 RepID=A0A254TCN3_9BURK|nr:2-hydroxychromene-2-carboxylate isomerase [Noviherbaspirillum denitrificans]OWW18323.1 disulfide bond formation protein DsbA [Noviherbaspirillum denitrificans]